MKFRNAIIFWLSVFVALGFLITGFSIGVDPRNSLRLALGAMTFPIWIIAMLVMSVVAALSRSKRTMILLLVVWIIGGYNLCSFSPFNFERSPKDGDSILTLMTFNTYGYKFDESQYSTDYNPTVSSIINCGADIVALQEAYTLEYPLTQFRITQAQCDSIKSIYPYRSFIGDSQAFLSKYPIKNIKLPELPTGSAQFSAYLVSLPTGPCHIFNVHLQSFRLNNEERQIYYDITDGDVTKQILSEAKKDIIPKVKVALQSHADEAEMLIRDIQETCPEGRLIVCGDFNDIGGCFPIKILCRDCDLKDAFRTGAFGPTYTYHVSRFYFNIDHVLYRGFERPLYTKRLKLPASDHYPVTTAFLMNAE